MFINIQDPSDTQKSHLRRAIRSQAALSSASCRKSTIAAKAATSSSSCSSSGSSPEAVTKSLIAKKRRKSRTSSVKVEVHEIQLDLTVEPDGTKSIAKALKAEAGQNPMESMVESVLFPAQLQEWNSRSDPFRTYPTYGSWHESIPRLVDTFLTYIATEEQDASYISDRKVLRNQFWPEVMSHSTLFFTSLLIATTHQSFICEYSPETVAWCRQKAVRSIQESLKAPSGPGASDTTIAAISLLAGWELEYGEDKFFYAHMQGLKTMVEMRGGIDEPSFPPLIRQIVLSVTHDLLLYAGLPPVFDSTNIQHKKWIGSSKPLTLPAGFLDLKEARLIIPVTMEFVAEVYDIMRGAGSNMNTLSSLELRLKDYSFTDYLSVSYCPIQSFTDDAINNQAESHIHLALRCLVCRLQQFNVYHLTMSSALLRPEKVLGTVYAEVCVWALVIVGSTLPYLPASLLQGLKRLILSQNIQEFAQLRQLMCRYLYPTDLEPTCEALWNQLAFDQDVDHGVIPITRYNVGVFRPKIDTLREIW